MTIDEAISKYKNRVEQYKGLENLKDIAEEHEQLAGWLEELKAYKEKPERWMWDEAEMQGYNKAIDDFVEKLKRENKETIPTHSGYCRMSFDEVVDEIAEQLKEGVTNE